MIPISPVPTQSTRADTRKRQSGDLHEASTKRRYHAELTNYSVAPTPTTSNQVIAGEVESNFQVMNNTAIVAAKVHTGLGEILPSGLHYNPSERYSLTQPGDFDNLFDV